MTHANDHPLISDEPERSLARPATFFGVVALLLTIAVVWQAAASPGEAEHLPEERAVGVGNLPAVAADIASSERQRTLDSRIHALIPDAERNCVRLSHPLPHPNDRPMTAAQSSLAAALQLVEESDVGDWLIRLAAARHVTVCLDHATSLEAHYRSYLGLLGLNARLSPAGRVVFLAHELAHVPQHPRYSNNRRFSPGDMLLLQRVREAAAEATATRVLWQLREKGFHEPWQQKLMTAYRDIAEAFEAAMAQSHHAADELRAARSSFHRWFEADWRLEIYDDLMLTTLARIARDPIGLIPTSRHLTDHFIRGVADYAGQGFLIHGDGSNLIDDFQVEDRSAGSRSRLNAILAESGSNAHEHDVTSVSGETLSAVSPMARPTADAR